MPIPNRKLRVFLCHASQDKPIVRELYRRLLAKAWIDPWLDEEKLLPGRDWELQIESAVESANAVIVCLSDNSVNKEGYIQKEIKKILDISDEKPDDSIFIIPLRLDSCTVPRRFRHLQWVDYFPTNNEKKAFERISESLKARAKILRIPFLGLLSHLPLNFQDYVELRSHLESSFIYQAITLLTDDDKNTLNMLVRSAYDKLNSIPVQIPHEEHRELHMLIFRHVQNSYVTSLLDGFWDAYEFVGLNNYKGPKDYLEEVWAYHAQIVDAISNNDFESAYQALVQHVDLLYHRPTE